MNVESLKIKTSWQMKTLGWFGILVGLVLIFRAWGNIGSIIFLSVAIVFLGVFIVVLASSCIKMDQETVAVVLPYARYRINWNEVTHIERNSKGDTIAFCGGTDKRLVIYTAHADRNKKLLPTFLDKQVEARGIEVTQSDSVPRTHLNVKV